MRQELPLIHEAVLSKDFIKLGNAVESNALAMHAMMLTSRPVVLYWQPETVAAMHKVWRLRSEGLPIYFTEDAGPNLKLIFLTEHLATVCEHFPHLDIVLPFGVDY